MNDQTKPAILVVDDSPLNLKFVLTALDRAGFSVLSAEEGISGLKMASENLPDLILLDIMMPGIDGYEVCRRLKANPATRQVPVIFMTALSDSSDKVRGFEVGAADYVTKPIDIPEVIARIHTQLEIYSLQQELQVHNQRLVEENQKRKRVQDALRESRWRYRLLAENSTDIISRQTMAGVYLYVSPSCRSLLGYKIEEMIGSSALDYLHPDDRELVDPVYDPDQDCPSTHVVTYRARRKDGEYIWLETISKTVCDSEYGQAYEIVAVARDVTERVALADELRMRNQELDAFAHTVAHDLKNPLATVISYADFLLGVWDRLNEEQIKDSIANIRGTGQKGLYIIDELMLLASVRRGDVELSPLDMADIVDQVQERLNLMIREYGAEVVLPDTWPQAVGYAAWIEEVWTNYLSNSFKYGGRPPVVELGASPASNGMLQFWVKDNGDGLSGEEQGRLFAEFVRLDEVRVEGHGLGLSIVRRIIEKLGGEVGVESQRGQGSRFYFTLPAAKTSD
jgi:PAS domain S-box-containing protein